MIDELILATDVSSRAVLTLLVADWPRNSLSRPG
jgi:hypothetical protein